MTTGMETFAPHTSAKELMSRMISGEESQFYITTEAGRLFGVVTMADLRRILMHREGLEQVLLAEDLAHENIPVCVPEESLSEALLKFEHSGFTELPVEDRALEGKLVGVLHYTEVFAMYNREVLQGDAAEGFVQRVGSADRHHAVKLVEGFSMSEWEPPSSLWGKTLVEAELPVRYRVRVVLIKKQPTQNASGELVPLVPGPDYVISEQDQLLVYGRDEDVEKLQKL
jgi:CBS domain-containing protein